MRSRGSEKQEGSMRAVRREGRMMTSGEEQRWENWGERKMVNRCRKIEQ